MENEKASYFEKTKITSAGLRLIHKLIMMGEPLVITKAVIGDGISEQDPVTMTELVHEIPSRQTGQDGTSAIVDLQMYMPEDEQTISTRVRVQNGDIEFTLREIAFIAPDPDIGDIIFAYTRDNTENAMTFPVFSGVPISATVDISFFVHNAANVEMNVTLPAEVSLAEFNAHKNAAELDHPDKSVKKRHIADYAIGTMQLEKGAVNNVRIGNNAVDARTIKDGEITKNKLSEELLEQINNLLSGATEFRKELDVLNSMFPSDSLRNVVSKLSIEVWKLQRAGHSEYEFYRVRCVSCTLKDGTKITNPKKEYIQYGDGTKDISFPSVGVSPDKPILIPLTIESLNKCLYIGEEQDGYLFLNFHLVYWATTEDKTEDGVTYVVYDNVTLNLNID